MRPYKNNTYTKTSPSVFTVTLTLILSFTSSLMSWLPFWGSWPWAWLPSLLV